MGRVGGGASILASIALALGSSACGGGPDIVDATPETQPTLTIPGGAGAGALGEEGAATTTPEGEPAPEGGSPEGQPDAPAGQTTPQGGPEEGAAPPEGTDEFGDFCEQNPGVQGC